MGGASVRSGRVDVIRWGEQRIRTGPWRGDRHVAYLTPVPDAPTPTGDFLRRCLDDLRGRGYARVVTGALGPSEQSGFLAAGFAVQEQLHLLRHDLVQLPPDPPMPALAQRRAVRADRPAVLAVDHRAFRPFWRLDEHGIDDALTATPHARFRVATEADGSIVGYAITGRSGRRGFVQRLAVDPPAQHCGTGHRLVVDGLRWLRRWRVEHAVVNTQLGNDKALALYERLGFRREAVGLSVLTVGL